MYTYKRQTYPEFNTLYAVVYNEALEAMQDNNAGELSKILLHVKKIGKQHPTTNAGWLLETLVVGYLEEVQKQRLTN